MDYPDYDFYCTLVQSRKVWKGGKHNLDVAVFWSSGTEGTASSTVAAIILGATIYSTSSCSQETKISGLLLIVEVSEDFFQLVA